MRSICPPSIWILLAACLSGRLYTVGIRFSWSAPEQEVDPAAYQILSDVTEYATNEQRVRLMLARQANNRGIVARRFYYWLTDRASSGREA
ncbi:MAG TPA: hypothetical protein VJX67_16450 [Blastocatellia bacterium]|nr:hypothetical protein [Blastocatellia bacterium]